MVDTEVEAAASERVAASLRAAILRGEIGPGERLRQEEVAARFGASRLPVREALRILQAEGLVELEANKGARIPQLSLAEVTLIYRMRERLEPLALGESMPHLTAEQIAELAAIEAAIEADADVAGFIELDREFHLLAYSGCTTEPLRSTVIRLWNSTQRHRRIFVTLTGQERRWVVEAEHRLILEAIERGDVTDAAHYLRGHIRRTRVELVRHPEVFA